MLGMKNHFDISGSIEIREVDIAGVACIFFFHLSPISNVLSFGRWLNMTEIMYFRLINPNGSFNYCRGRPRLVLVNRLEGLSLPRNSTTVN